MCRWTLGTVEHRCGVLLDPNSGVVGRIRGREFHLSSDPLEIETFFFFSNVSKHYFMRYAGSLDVRCVRTCVCNQAAVTAAEELHARTKGTQLQLPTLRSALWHAFQQHTRGTRPVRPNHRPALLRVRDPKPVPRPPGTTGGPGSPLSDIRLISLEGKGPRT